MVKYFWISMKSFYSCFYILLICIFFFYSLWTCQMHKSDFTVFFVFQMILHFYLKFFPYISPSPFFPSVCPYFCPQHTEFKIFKILLFCYKNKSNINHVTYLSSPPSHSSKFHILLINSKFKYFFHFAGWLL